MSNLAQAAWTHGLGIFLEDKSWSIDRTGAGGIVYPSNTSLDGWIHFVIPTPVVVNNTRLAAKQAIVRLSTGAKALIRTISVHDGDTLIANFGVQVSSPNVQTYFYPISSPPQVFYGLQINVEVVFADRSTDAWANFVGGGIDFQ